MNLEYKSNFNFEVSDLKQKNNVVVFFLSLTEKANDNYLSFPEALNKGVVDVSEVTEKGFITKLKIVNKSSNNLLILNGECILGTKIRQNRIVDSTVLIPGYATVLINTFCGERYRWSPKLSNDISVSESLYSSKGRANFSDNDTKLSKQYKIWSEIENKLSELKAKSFTFSVEEIYKKRKNNVEEIVNFFRSEESQHVGVALGINNCLVSLDIFSNNYMLQVYLPRLIRSVALDSFKKMNYKSYLKVKDVHKFLRQIHEANKQKRKVVKGALGEEIHFSSETINGSALYYKKKVVHCAAFLKDRIAVVPKYEYNVA